MVSPRRSLVQRMEWLWWAAVALAVVWVGSPVLFITVLRYAEVWCYARTLKGFFAIMAIIDLCVHLITAIFPGSEWTGELRGFPFYLLLLVEAIFVGYLGELIRKGVDLLPSDLERMAGKSSLQRN